MERVDVAIVGGGVVGLAAAWRLASAGRDVVVLEQFDVGHANGSSHGSTRIFRFAYDDPAYVRLAQAALPLWRELESVAGRDLLRITGGIDVGDDPYLEACASALEVCGARVERLSAEACRDRFNWLRAGDEAAVFSPDTGFSLLTTLFVLSRSRHRAWARVSKPGHDAKGSTSTPDRSRSGAARRRSRHGAASSRRAPGRLCFFRRSACGCRRT